ncbi:hypothetical protein MHYP_G00090260 [Metynnis hypsauchen]
MAFQVAVVDETIVRHGNHDSGRSRADASRALAEAASRATGNEAAGWTALTGQTACSRSAAGTMLMQLKFSLEMSMLLRFYMEMPIELFENAHGAVEWSLGRHPCSFRSLWRWFSGAVEWSMVPRCPWETPKLLQISVEMVLRLVYVAPEFFNSAHVFQQKPTQLRLSEEVP